MEDPKYTPEQEHLPAEPETEPETDEYSAPAAENSVTAPEPEETEEETEESSEEEPEEESEEESAEESEEEPEEESAPGSASPARPKNTRQNLLLLLGTLLVIFLVYLSTSLIYKISRGETWNPFAFLTRRTTEAQLPTVPTVPVQVLPSLTDKTAGDLTLPFVTTAVPASVPSDAGRESSSAASTEETTEGTAEKTTEEPTSATEEPTAATEEPTTTTEEPTATTEEPTTTTEEPTTTTEEPTTTTEEPSTEWVPDFTILEDHLHFAHLEESDLKGTQLIIAQGSVGGKCQLYFFEKTDAGWIPAEAVPMANATISPLGVSTSRPAGSSNTPGGLFAVGPVYGTEPSVITDMPYQQIQEGDLWITDPASSFYNQLVSASQKKDWKSALDLSVMSEAFQYALLVQYNTSPVDPALGTAIFLNSQTDQDSGGSVSMLKPALFSLLQWLKPDSDPHILIYAYETVQE